MTLSSRQTRDEESVTYLRAELAHAVDPSRRARLLFEIALAEERNNEEGAAVRDYFAAHHADTDFAEPPGSASSRWRRRIPRSKDRTSSLRALIGVASSPDEQVRARVERALHQADVRGDLSDAKATAAAATALAGASAGESACAWLALEILAGRTKDAEMRRQALAGRANPGARSDMAGTSAHRSRKARAQRR